MLKSCTSLSLFSLCGLFLLPIMSCDSAEEFLQEVQVTGGTISGFKNKSGDVTIFKGIPFAAPPVDSLRWVAPQPVLSWQGIRKCEDFGPSPMQDKPSPFMYWSSEFLIPEEPISEDCLYLNLWTPAKSMEDNLPVMVYLYGGGFRSGGSGCAIYDGERTAQKGVIFVSINYRVGPFGFFVHPDLSREADSGTSGNYGILDMIAALEWIKENISKFGGDPHKVTIAGQSAGAFGVNYLVNSPLAKNLFSGAIAESGGNILENPHRPQPDLSIAEGMGLELVAESSFEDFDSFRKAEAQTILSMRSALSWPIIDGYVLPATTMSLFNKGEQNDVPLLAGWNANDIVMGEPMAKEDFEEMIDQRFDDLKAELIEAYDADSISTASFQKEMNRDEIFGVQVYNWAKLQATKGKSPVFLYNFTRSLPAYSEESQFGAFHSGEIVYAYNNLATMDRPWEPVDHKIANQMSQYWVNFAKTGNPNGESLPDWSPFNLEEKGVMIIDSVFEFVSLPTIDKLTFWENYFTSNN